METLTKIELSDSQLQALERGDMVFIPADWDEFWDFLETSNRHVEFHNYQIIIMGLAKFIHEVLVGRLIKILLGMYDANSFFVTGSNVGLIKENQMGYYNADVLVVKGNPEFWGKSEAIITNPYLVVEIISESTAQYDYDVKREAYKLFPSLQQVVFVNPIIKRVNTLTRTEDPKVWLDISYTEKDEIVKIDGSEVPFAEIFANLPTAAI